MASAAHGPEVPVWRLNLLRLACLCYLFGGFATNLPRLFAHAPDERGLLASIFGGLWILALVGLRYPLKIMPVFLFEFAWKSIWAICFGLPQWWAGIGSPRLSQDLVEVGLFAVLTALVIPWDFVWCHYVRAPAERWR